MKPIIIKYEDRWYYHLSVADFEDLIKIEKVLLFLIPDLHQQSSDPFCGSPSAYSLMPSEQQHIILRGYWIFKPNIIKEVQFAIDLLWEENGEVREQDKMP